MPEQVSLTEYGVAVTITLTQETTPSRDLNPRELTAVILNLKPAVKGHCSLCNRSATLPFCLEYLDGEANVLMWGQICEDCAGHVWKILKGVL